MYLVIVALVLLAVALCGLHFGSDHHEGVAVSSSALPSPVAGAAFVLVLVMMVLGAFGVLGVNRTSGIPPPFEGSSTRYASPRPPSLLGADALFAPIRC